jgi:signal transduction histidine kinase
MVKRSETADNSRCGGGDIGVFFSRGREVAQQSNGAFIRQGLPGHPPDLAFGGCLRDTSGTLWLATDAGLYERRAAGSRWRLAMQNLAGGEPATGLVSDPSGGLWLFSLHHLCRYRSDKPIDCVDLPTDIELRDADLTSDGALLLATDDGVYRFRERRFERIALSPAPISLALVNISASPRGGYWIVGPGIFQRIALRGRSAVADVVEQPSIRQGLPGNEAVAMAETTAGDLWIAGNRGLFRVPAAVRRLSACPRRVVVVGASIDGAVQPDRQALVLQPGQHQLTIAISALSYKDPAGVMYRYRTDPKGPWSSPSTNAVLQFIDPDAGRHAIDVTASVDGVAWAPPTRIVFRVRPHWWASLWAWAAYALIVTALLVVAYRLRMAHILSLERQRLRIAMDLHDEIGSNLGSIGLLAGEAARHAGDRERLPHLIGQITSLAQLTHVGLRLVGHNLKSDQGALTDLARDIRVQVKRLIHEDELDLRFVVEPRTAQLDISSTVHRHALMIVVEAVHNALKYADAGMLVITLSVVAAGRWRLTIADDGRGFDPAAARGTGSGLENMNRRTHEAGGALDLDTAPGGGTRISITFPARVRRRAIGRLPDAWVAWFRRKAGVRSDSGAKPW